MRRLPGQGTIPRLSTSIPLWIRGREKGYYQRILLRVGKDDYMDPYQPHWASEGGYGPPSPRHHTHFKQH